MNCEARMISSRRIGRDSLLFVYGTLRPFVDIPMAQWLRRAARYVGPATTRGRLYDLGAYPGMRAARGRGELVAGDLYRVSTPEVWRVLDRYERGVARQSPVRPRSLCRARRARRAQDRLGLSVLLRRRRRGANFQRRLSRAPSTLARGDRHRRPRVRSTVAVWRRLPCCSVCCLRSAYQRGSHDAERRRRRSSDRDYVALPDLTARQTP